MPKTDMRIDLSFVDHPKIKRLIRKSGYEAFYGLIRIYSIAGKLYTKGIFKGCTEEDIEDFADWHGKSGELVQVLVSTGLLEKNNGVYKIHDWEKHQPWIYNSEVRSENAKKSAKARWSNEIVESNNEETDTERMRDACETHNNRNAPSPIPTPIPTPSPIPFPIPKEKESCSELSKEISGTPFIDLPMVGSVSSPLKTFTVTEEDVKEYQEVYTNVDVKAELKKMKLWLDANPTKRKKNVKAFIARWLAKAQDRPKPERKKTHEEILEEMKKRYGDI